MLTKLPLESISLLQWVPRGGCRSSGTLRDFDKTPAPEPLVLCLVSAYSDEHDASRQVKMVRKVDLSRLW